MHILFSGDALHLLELGIMKRILKGWRDGTLGNHKAKWTAEQILAISSFLKATKLPKELNKRPLRGLDGMAHWKGFEYKTFLLYASIVVVKEFFKGEPLIVDHFMHFYTGVIICIRKNQDPKNYDIAQKLFLNFLEGVKILYSRKLFTSNMHNLIHLVDDVKRFGPLDTFSAYSFESRLYHLKRLVRTGNLPLQQVANRITEIQQNL